MASNEEIIRNFIAAWSRLDVEELLDYFAEDGVYYNMPIAPVSGRANLRPFIGAFLKDWTRTDWEILNIVGVGNVVIAERMDHTELGDKKVALENGKIKVWRDYFDMATYQRALQ